MLERLSAFFLLNTKIAIVVIVTIMLAGIASYILLPKQYNPSIVAPAFVISVPVSGYTAADAYRSVATTLENVLSELPGIDTITSSSQDGMVSVMVSFKVGMNQEATKTQLYDKLTARSDLRPFGVNDVFIKAIDPEDLPQISFAITTTATGISYENQNLAIRNAATVLRDAIKLVPNTSVIEVLGGFRWDVYITIDPAKLNALNLDLTTVLQTIQDQGMYMVAGKQQTNHTSTTTILLSGGANTKERLAKLPIGWTIGKRIFLEDIATIGFSPQTPSSYQEYANPKTKPTNAVFLAVAKAKWANAVTVVDAVLRAVEQTQKQLPKDIIITPIQNEGETARLATNELLFHLFISIAIVVGILVVFLGWRNALNAAFCIPLVLAIVFVVAIILGLDINRITLFALILSLGILVDDSIVMVENNARHLSEVQNSGHSPLEALLASVREVGPSVLFSTITRIMSFVAMFAVTGMMGDYMKPIPIFATIALTASLFVAFSINPFLAHTLYKKDQKNHTEEGGGKWLAKYARLIQKFSQQNKQARARRKSLRIGFWVALGLVMVLPVMLDVFRVRMLPKADKDQVYLWIDLPTNQTAATTRMAGELMAETLLGAKQPIPKELAIVKDISLAVGTKLPDDFANLFRGGSFRVGENQLSMRINLTPHEERSISSEQFVIGMRPLLRQAILAQYPDARIRLLEDPPGPPTMATLEIRLKGWPNTNTGNLVRFSEAVERTVRSIATQEQVMDLVNSVESPRMQTTVQLKPEQMMNRGISAQQVAQTLALAYNARAVWTPQWWDTWIYEPRDIVVEVQKDSTGKDAFLPNLSFISSHGERVRLDEIATMQTTPAASKILSEGRSPVITLSAEIGNSSVIYPVLTLYGLLEWENFEKFGYRKVSATPYGITFTGIKDGKTYQLEWWGEWEITMDTFRDLGSAMILSLLAIYFLIVGQFGSFKTGGLVMTTFLLSFFGIMPGFGILYLVSWEYFTATAMIGAIALGGIVVGNAILLLDAIDRALQSGLDVAHAVADGAKKRVIPVLLTSLAAIFGSFVITSDPVWSGLAWAIITGLSASAVLTLFFIPVFYSDHITQNHS